MVKETVTNKTQVTDDTPFTDDVDWNNVQVVDSQQGLTVHLDDEEAPNGNVDGNPKAFIGYYTDSSHDIETDNGLVSVHRFEDKQGNRFSIWGSYDLNTKLTEVPSGSMVRVEYLERIELSKGRTLKRYKVQVA